MRSLASVAVLCMLLAGCGADQQGPSPLAPAHGAPPSLVTYIPRFLGAVPGMPNSTAWSINDWSWVVGVANPDGLSTYPVVWDPGGAPKVLPYFIARTFGGKQGDARSINNNLMIVGSLEIPVPRPGQGGGEVRAVYWPSPVSTPIVIGPPGYPSNALDVNAAGTVVGWMGTGAGGGAFMWSSTGGLRQLPDLPGSYQSSAQAIDDGGRIVGYSELPGCRKPVRWGHGRTGDYVVDLTQGAPICGEALDVAVGYDPVGFTVAGPPHSIPLRPVRFGENGPVPLVGGDWTRPMGISTRGRLALFNMATSSPYSLTSGLDGVTNLFPPVASQSSVVVAVNRCGQIVGSQADNGSWSYGSIRAVIWDGGNPDCPQP